MVKNSIVFLLLIFSSVVFAKTYQYKGISLEGKGECQVSIIENSGKISSVSLFGTGWLSSITNPDVMAKEKINFPYDSSSYIIERKNYGIKEEIYFKKVQGLEIDRYELNLDGSISKLNSVKGRHVVKLGAGVFAKTIFDFETTCQYLKPLDPYSFSSFNTKKTTIAFKESSDNPSFWKDVTYDFQNTERLINNEHCYYNDVSFSACMYGINHMLVKRQFPRKIVLPSNFLFKPSNLVVSTLEKKNNYVVAQFNVTGDVDVEKEIKLINEYIKSVNNAWKVYYRINGAEKLISFPELLNNLITNYVSDKDYKLSAINVEVGHMVMEYFDHAVLYPMSYIVDLQSPENEYEGLGVSLEETVVGFIVKDIFNDNTSAKGLRKYDVITKVDGISILTIDMIELISLLRGKENTEVTLTVRRGRLVLDLTLSRSRSKFSNIKKKNIVYDNTQIGYLSIQSFMPENTCSEARSAIEELVNQGVQSLILDLRGNGGGDASLGECVANLFLKKGSRIGGVSMLYDFVASKAADDLGLVLPIIAKKDHTTDLPLTVLMDSDSASASELVIGALAFNNRAILVGERSYGKGSGQFGTPYGNSQDLFGLITMQRFLVGENHSHQLVGLFPHLEVASKEHGKLSLREEDFAINPLPAIHQPIKRELSQSLKTCYATAIDYLGVDVQVNAAIKISKCISK